MHGSFFFFSLRSGSNRAFWRTVLIRVVPSSTGVRKNEPPQRESTAGAEKMRFGC